MPQKKTKSLSWNARRRGLIYCASACGNCCTRAEYEQAVTDGKKLARRLGPKWTSNVWENLGWHYKVVSPCKRIKVYPNRGGDFSAFIGPSEDTCGGRFVEHGKTPELAILHVIASVKKELSKLQALYKGLE